MHDLIKSTLLILASLVTLLGVPNVLAEPNAAKPSVAEEIHRPVNINTASAEEISIALKGVGIKRAEQIVAYRKAHGAFKTKEALLDVKGVGKKILEKNRSAITLE